MTSAPAPGVLSKSRPAPEISICTVTYNAEADLEAFFEAWSALDGGPYELTVVDCASTDRTPEILERARAPHAARSRKLEVLPQASNLGFTGGMNLALDRTLARATGDWVLLLNADARPEPGFAERLTAAAREAPDDVGAITPKLLSGTGTRIDAAGMRLVPGWRHLNRGSGQPDDGRFEARREVFGGTGAATLFRRAALLDVALDGEVFLEEFHSFREDAELAFRLRERGWRVLYEPAARCHHDHRNTPASRRRMSPAVNFHSLKNRYLLRAYHGTWASALATFPAAAVRDLGIAFYVALFERSSIAAYRWLWNRRSEIRRRRQAIRRRRTRSPWATARWFWRSSRPAPAGSQAGPEPGNPDR